jgi:hypothetical protein
LYFFDVDFTTKAQYSINHASTITYGYKNQTASVDNIYSNPIITNYRNLLFSDGINFTTLFPYHQINYDHFIFDTKNKNTIIFNLNYKISNNAIGTQVTNSNEITLTSYNSIDKDETVSLFLFYEKKNI